MCLCVAYQNIGECALLNLQENIRTDGISGEDQSACSEGTDDSWTLTNARINPVETKISTCASNVNSHHQNSWQLSIDHL